MDVDNELMNPASPSDSFPGLHRTKVLLATVIILSCFYFFTGGGANQAAHFSLVRSIIEEGRIQIDTFQWITGDVSKFEGHWYSNKAPGLPFFAVPFVTVAHGIARGLGLNTSGEHVLHWEARVAILFGSTLPTAAIVILIFSFARRLGATPGAAAFGALMYGLGTTAWSYGTIFWAHPLTAACLFSGYMLAVLLSGPDVTARDLKLGVASGFFAGWAVLTEYHALGGAAIIAGLGLWNVRAQGWTRLRRVVAAITAGAAVPALLMFTYHYAAFGSPFRVSYQSTLTVDHEEGFLGVTYPKPYKVVGLLIGEHRGFIPSAPVLIISLAGLLTLGRNHRYRSGAVAAGAIFVYFFLLNSSVNYWVAGWNFGPRYMFPGLALLAVGLAPAWDLMNRWGRLMLSGLGAVSVFINFIAVAVQPFAPVRFLHPIRELYLPAFLDGRLSINKGPFYGDFPSRAFNLGEACGLKGLPSLLPLLALWALAVGIWYWRIPRVVRPTGSKGPV